MTENFAGPDFASVVKKDNMRGWSLFSGIGGMDEGMRRAGIETTLFCEYEEYRREVLRERFGADINISSDVREVASWARGRTWRPGLLEGGSGGSDAERVRVPFERAVASAGRPDIIFGGFPCQDLSVAGAGAGLEGDRSGLFFSYAEILEAVRPDWFLIENVPGLFSSKRGRDFGVLLDTLADLGYGVAWRTLNSRYFGVPQRRRRVFILGAYSPDDPRTGAECAGEVLAVGHGCGWHPATSGDKEAKHSAASLSGLGSGGPDDNDAQANRLVVADDIVTYSADGSWTVKETDVSPTIDGRVKDGPRRNQGGLMVAHDVAHALSTKRMRFDPNGEDYVVDNGYRVRRLLPVECERLQGLPDGWTDITWKNKPASDTRRYAAVGDAVTVNVAEWIGSRILQVGLEG